VFIGYLTTVWSFDGQEIITKITSFAEYFLLLLLLFFTLVNAIDHYHVCQRDPPLSRQSKGSIIITAVNGIHHNHVCHRDPSLLHQ
jgi:hypothetical protein